MDKEAMAFFSVVTMAVGGFIVKMWPIVKEVLLKLVGMNKEKEGKALTVETHAEICKSNTSPIRYLLENIDNRLQKGDKDFEKLFERIDKSNELYHGLDKRVAVLEKR